MVPADLVANDSHQHRTLASLMGSIDQREMDAQVDPGRDTPAVQATPESYVPPDVGTLRSRLF